MVDSFTTCCREGSSVVVDVHQAGRGGARQSSDRVSRGHSESERQRSAEVQLHNCDRIETVGEERARHLSESAAGPSHWTAGRRKRAATLGCEVSSSHVWVRWKLVSQLSFCFVGGCQYSLVYKALDNSVCMAVCQLKNGNRFDKHSSKISNI